MSIMVIHDKTFEEQIMDAGKGILIKSVKYSRPYNRNISIKLSIWVTVRAVFLSVETMGKSVYASFIFFQHQNGKRAKV